MLTFLILERGGYILPRERSSSVTSLASPCNIGKNILLKIFAVFVDLGGEEEDGLVHVADAGGDDSEGEAREDVGVVTLTKIFIYVKK